MMTDDQILEVVAAHKEGKKIQSRVRGNGLRPEEGWGSPSDKPDWNFYCWDYRVAPEPRKPREWPVWVDPEGVISQFGNHSGKGCATRITVREVLE